MYPAEYGGTGAGVKVSVLRLKREFCCLQRGQVMLNLFIYIW